VSVRRLASTVVLAIVIGVGLAIVIRAAMDWPLGDLHVYLDAAMRIRDGEPLYVADVPSYAAFWYAPWFAVAFVPLTFVPYPIVAVAWSSILVFAAVGAVWPLVRQPTRATIGLASLMAGLLIGVAAGGNVQPLLILALVRTFHTPMGPLSVAVAASLKLTPGLLILSYLAHRAWRRAIVAAALTLVLVMPGVLLGQIREVSGGISALALFGISPLLYVAAVAAAAAAVFIVRPRYATLLAALAGVLALPRLFAYDVTLTLVAAAERSGLESAREGSGTTGRTEASGR
jgi:hypothetical protein